MRTTALFEYKSMLPGKRWSAYANWLRANFSIYLLHYTIPQTTIPA